MPKNDADIAIVNSIRLKNKIAIVVPSCDKYSDLWDALFSTVRLRWPACPLPIYLVTNFIEYTSLSVTAIKVGEDKSWSQNLILALKHVPHEYIFLFIDDLFLTQHIDNERVISLIQRCIDNSWDYLRFNPTPGPVASNMIDRDVGYLPQGDWYRSSTVFSLWRKDVLLDLLEPSENAWELEIYGSSRTDKYTNWYASNKCLMPYVNLVIKGKIDPLSLRSVSEAGIDLKTDRAVMTIFEVILHQGRKLRSGMINFIPRPYRRYLRSLFSPS